MKKLPKVLFLWLVMISLVACQSKPNENENASMVQIIDESKSATLSETPIVLTSKLTSNNDKDIQYHWMLKSDEENEDLIGFIASQSGPLKEVVNSGQPVEIGLFSEFMRVEGSEVEFKVMLQVEETDSSSILEADEITIIIVDGKYKIE